MEMMSYPSPNPMMAPHMYNIGGYPNYGYPPAMPMGSQYSPFFTPYSNPQPTPFIPGVTVPMEVTTKEGQTYTIPASAGNQGFVPGGTTISQGGFNPVSNTVSGARGSTGFNPFVQFNGTPIPQQGFINPALLPGKTPIQDHKFGFEPFDPDKQNSSKPQIQPMMGMGIYGFGNLLGNPYVNRWQNSFDVQIQELLYNEEPSAMDVRSMLEKVILTDEERAKIDRNRSMSSIIGYDYYGNPIYSNPGSAYQTSAQRQKEFEEARVNYQKHFTNLSRIAHAYSGETIDEAAMMDRFDPVPKAAPMPSQRMFNYFEASEEERKEFEETQLVTNTARIINNIEYVQSCEETLNQQKRMLYSKIKESHDKLIGVNPGESYDLKQYMDNGYKIGVNIAMQKAKTAMRNGKIKYSSVSFRDGIAQYSNNPVPVSTKDDEYMTTSIEQRIKAIYDRNKVTDSILRGQGNGMLPPTITSQAVKPTVPEFGSEFEAHKFFLEYAYGKKGRDEVLRLQRGVI